MKEQVVVAMSGGVDSSVAAALLKEEGYEVIGMTMQVLPSGKDPSCSSSSLETIRAAREVAMSLDIPYYVLHLEEIFEERVISYFCQEYREARTPNPCIRCNQEIKFKALLEKARELEADYLATGHYARIIHRDRGPSLIKRGRDHKKDQSYALYRLTQEQLPEILMPLGVYRKDEVREMALKMDLLVHDREESQEICFVPDNDYRSFLKERDPSLLKEGPILDREGNRLGTHRGLAFYTIGQRKGLGISTLTPKYVLDLDLERNALIVGDDRDVYRPSLLARDLNWVSIPDLSQPLEVMAQIRYNTEAEKALVQRIEDDCVEVTFQKKQRAITPGQAVVFYEGDLLLGGGCIEKSLEKSIGE